LLHAAQRRLRPHNRFSYLAIGSIINRAHDRSVVWGSGAFGTETRRVLNRHAKYLAVRGPLTRNKLRVVGIDCPEVYGDPALLLPLVFDPRTKPSHKVGLVLRHSEAAALSGPLAPDMRVLTMRSNDVEGTITDMLACERIATTSLHGLVIADAYGIPSAWLASDTPKGLDFKYYDYFLAVGKLRRPQPIDLTEPLSRTRLDILKYDDQVINFDSGRLIEASPFVEP